MSANGEPRDSRDHFNIEEDQYEFYRRLARPDGGADSRVFDSLSSMFVFVASLAFARGLRRPIKGRRRDVFRWANLDEINQTLLRALAMADPGGGVDVLMDRGRIADVVEEYAAAGVDVLRSDLGDDPARDRAIESLSRLGLEASR